uniref:Uncharacterized protein n=1 Tax=Anguilla anguilla TaxID=7936 RepID=A0A0E9QNQ5_ANGAN
MHCTEISCYVYEMFQTCMMGSVLQGGVLPHQKTASG